MVFFEFGFGVVDVVGGGVVPFVVAVAFVPVPVVVVVVVAPFAPFAPLVPFVLFVPVVDVVPFFPFVADVIVPVAGAVDDDPFVVVPAICAAPLVVVPVVPVGTPGVAEAVAETETEGE